MASPVGTLSNILPSTCSIPSSKNNVDFLINDFG
jgi:hypothetical protein